jgi:hypothetical protein
MIVSAIDPEVVALCSRVKLVMIVSVAEEMLLQWYQKLSKYRDRL